MAEVAGIRAISDFMSLAKWWLHGKNMGCVNVLTTAVLWTIWKMRNNMCFQGVCWLRMEALFGRCARLIRD
jgi:hypothetical protein